MQYARRTAAHRREWMRLKSRAFVANSRAKVSHGSAREDLYRIKAAAINILLAEGCAFVNDVNWAAPDPVIGVRFEGGGKLHTKLSCLDSGAFKSIRRQLNGAFQPQSAADYAEFESTSAA
jgi:hypothetical protein